mmetsp:Transcript_26774/g.64247  ORF Transcript_26774/g.64247 Transcript_26774/m.64247 type:complete len:235 (+) Transcript_26774:661-1365(+)
MSSHLLVLILGIVIIFVWIVILLLQARHDLREGTLDETLSISKVVDVVFVVLIIGVVVNIRKGLLVGVPCTLIVGENGQLHTISIGGAHGTNIQVEVAPLNTCLLALRDAANPLRHRLVELVASLDLVILIILINVALGGLTLVAVDVLLVLSEHTFNSSTAELLVATLGELALGLLELTLSVLLFVLLFFVLFVPLIVLLFVILFSLLFTLVFILGFLLLLFLLFLLALRCQS